MTQLHDLTALEQGAAVRRREVSPLELVDHYLGRTDDVGAFVTQTPERARERARDLAMALAHDTGDDRMADGPL